MRHIRRTTCLFCFFYGITTHALYAQAAAGSPKPGADVIIFTDGEKIIGHLERADDSSVVFKSDMVGEITVDWSKIQELRSPEKFAVIPKGVKLRNSKDLGKAAQGTVVVTDQKVQLNTGAQSPPQTIPVSNVAAVVPAPAFERGFQNTGFFKGWKGGATGGISLTEATQKNQTYTAALNIVRAVPSENWLDVRNRTIFDLNEAYGKLSQPGSPAVKTSLFHLDAEQDHYLSPRLFVFGHAAFDHSFSQGLDLQQTYGGGIGFVVFKQVNQELDVKASADYIDQQFAVSNLNKKLFGTIFGETYVRKFARGILLNEQGSITPT